MAKFFINWPFPSISFSDIGVFMCLFLFVLLIFVLVIKSFYEYKIRNVQVIILLLGFYASLALVFSDLDLFGVGWVSSLLCYVVFITAATQLLYLIFVDIFDSNCKKQTLWWKLQYFNMPAYKQRAVTEIKPFVKLWSKTLDKHSKKLTISIFGELTVFTLITFYFLVTYVFPFYFVGNLLLGFLVFSFISLNFWPVLCFYIPFVLITFLCGNEKFKGYIAKTYGPTQLKDIKWNTNTYPVGKHLTRFSVAVGLAYAGAHGIADDHNKIARQNWENEWERKRFIDRYREAHWHNSREAHPNRNFSPLELYPEPELPKKITAWEVFSTLGPKALWKIVKKKDNPPGGGSSDEGGIV